jgi:hypothetical protein
MHKSRLAGFIIDCDCDDLNVAANFWSDALGYRTIPDADDSKYVTLETGENDPYIEVQRVSHQSRVHLDIETDDIEAEVIRLEKLGARRVEQIRGWWVMQAPTGQKFCVVRPQKKSFDENANVWD